MEKNLGGAPEHKPTPESKAIVAELYAAGIPQSRIADRFNIDEKTLRKWYRAELDESKDRMIAKLGSNLYQDALNGDKQAREFWLKCQGRWSYAKPPEEKEKDDKRDALLEKLIDKI